MKPSLASLDEPLLHLVGDAGGRADEGEPAVAAEALGELADGQVLALGQLDHALASALAGVGLGNLGQRPVGSKPEASWPSAIESDAMALA